MDDSIGCMLVCLHKAGAIYCDNLLKEKKIHYGTTEFVLCASTIRFST